MARRVPSLSISTTDFSLLLAGLHYMLTKEREAFRLAYKDGMAGDDLELYRSRVDDLVDLLDRLEEASSPALSLAVG